MPPSTKTTQHLDEICGISIPDPYRWLEYADDPEVTQWVEEQNRHVNAQLHNDLHNTFSRELTEIVQVVNFSNPIPVNGSYFYTERRPGEDQGVLYVRHGLEGEPVKLVDPNGKKEGNTVSLDFWQPSPTGAHVVYGLSEGGDEMATLYVKDVATGRDLPESMSHCRHSAVRWLPDETGFFYTRNPQPGRVPKNEEHLHTKVFFHRLGSPMERDALIFGEGRPKDDMIQLSISPDGRYLGIYVSPAWTENDIYLYDREAGTLKPLVEGVAAQFEISFLFDKVLLRTNLEANNFRVLSASYRDMLKPIAEWQEFIPEREFVLESLSVTREKLLLEYLANACSEVLVFDHAGKELETLPLPPFSTFSGISARRAESEFFYGVESFTFPKITYHYRQADNAYETYRKTDNPIDPDQYVTKQEWYASKDGTRVPMFIFHKNDVALNGQNPTILYGYGGFGSSETPAFMRNFVPWLERSGVFAVANIRGGGEFGDRWHKQGIKEFKQNTFDDFIRAAEHLVDLGYTNAERLGILGASNGGLLVSAVAVQRPELFHAVCSRVPLTDMVRFPHFGMATRWVHEYGDPNKKEELDRILAWSPYHNVKAGSEYPHFLFTTGNRDTRVNPLHARKMAARLQAVNKANKVYLFTQMEAGHGAGKPMTKIIELQAYTLAFFSQTLGLAASPKKQ